MELFEFFLPVLNSFMWSLNLYGNFEIMNDYNTAFHSFNSGLYAKSFVLSHHAQEISTKLNNLIENTRFYYISSGLRYCAKSIVFSSFCDQISTKLNNHIENWSKFCLENNRKG